MSHDASIILRQEGESAFFREVLDSSPVPTFILERRGTALLVTYVNRSFERRTKYSAATILDKDWRMYEEKRRNHLRTERVFAVATRAAFAMQHSMP